MENTYNTPTQPHTEDHHWFDSVAKVVSQILVPLLMPLYGSLLVFTLSPLRFVSPGTKLVSLLIIVGITAVLPALLFVVLKMFRIINDIGLNERKERFIPYLITILSLCGAAWYLWSRNAPDWFVLFFIGGAAGGVINLIVNFWWKISAHAAGMAGILAMLMEMMRDQLAAPSTLIWLIVWVLLTGLLGTARVWMHRHTPAQVLCGYVAGFVSVWVAMSISLG